MYLCIEELKGDINFIEKEKRIGFHGEYEVYKTH